MKQSRKQARENVWCDKHEATRILGLSESTLKKLRLTNQLIEGIHWTRFSSRCIRYNTELLKDWAATRVEAASHDQAIDSFLSSLPSNQPRPRGRKRNSR